MLFRSGPVIWALMAYPHIVFFPINPHSAASFRAAFHASGKKDDPVDAETHCDMVQQHHDQLRALKPADPETRKLMMLSEARRKLVDDKTRETNRLRAALKSYYPQALELAGELDTRMACAFLRRWPTLQQLERSRRSTIEQFYHRQACRSRELIETRLTTIAQAAALTEDPAVVAAGRIQVVALAGVIACLVEAIANLDRELARVYHAHDEYTLIKSFPGAGPALGPRLVALLGSDRARFESANQLQRFTGVAPVTIRTGGTHGSKLVHRRYRRSKFLHQTVIEWAACFCRGSLWGGAYYQREADKGRSRWSILRSLGYKLLRILYQCWKTRTPYDEEVYLKSLHLHGSTLVEALAA